MNTARNCKALIGLLTAVGGLVLSAGISAQAQSFDMSWHTIDGGGGTSTGGAFSVSGTIGQPDAGEVLYGGPYELTGGFWPITNTCFCPGDLNGDGLRDGRDVQGFANCVTSGGACSCADVDQFGGLTTADIAAFVNMLLATTPCP